MADDDILIWTEGALARIRLARPEAANALTTAMRASVAEALRGWQPDPMIYAVVIDAQGDRAFCAGGDLREMLAQLDEDPALARAAIAAEYALNWQIACYTKPIVSFVNGACFGSGVGLTAFATHPVAGAGYRFAMPETGVGYFPDVGATWLLGRLADRIGIYLGLSGRSLGGGDALRLGLAGHIMTDPAKQAEVVDALREAAPVDALLDARGEDADREESEIEPYREVIARCFAGDRISAVLAALEAESGEAAGWCASLREELETKSPRSLAVTLDQLRDPLPDIDACLVREYRQACRFIEDPDLREGVRAVLIDKDRAPQWGAAIGSDGVADYFKAPPTGDLELAPRPQPPNAIA